MSDAPKPIRIESTGKLTMRTDADGSVSPDTRGPVHLHIESIKSIGVENLVDIEVHTN